MTRSASITIALALLLAGAAQATPEDLRSVAGMEKQDRVLLVFTPTLADPRLTQQRAIMARAAIGASERDLLLVQVDSKSVLGAHDDATKLRQRFQVPQGVYRTLLIGKDGHIALAVPGPIDAPRIMHAIDAMPTRRAELRQAR